MKKLLSRIFSSKTTETLTPRAGFYPLVGEKKEEISAVLAKKYDDLLATHMLDFVGMPYAQKLLADCWKRTYGMESSDRDRCQRFLLQLHMREDDDGVICMGIFPHRGNDVVYMPGNIEKNLDDDNHFALSCEQRAITLPTRDEIDDLIALCGFDAIIVQKLLGCKTDQHGRSYILLADTFNDEKYGVLMIQSSGRHHVNYYDRSRPVVAGMLTRV